MIALSQEVFEQIVGEAMDAQPEKYMLRLKNVVFVVDDDPTPEQRTKLHLHNNQTLWGLYEGIPQTARGNSYNLVLPDKITIFKNPILASSNTLMAKSGVPYAVSAKLPAASNEAAAAKINRRPGKLGLFCA